MCINRFLQLIHENPKKYIEYTCKSNCNLCLYQSTVVRYFCYKLSGS